MGAAGDVSTAFRRRVRFPDEGADARPLPGRWSYDATHDPAPDWTTEIRAPWEPRGVQGPRTGCARNEKERPDRGCDPGVPMGSAELPLQGSNLDSSDPESDVLPVTPRGSARPNDNDTPRLRQRVRAKSVFAAGRNAAPSCVRPPPSVRARRRAAPKRSRVISKTTLKAGRGGGAGGTSRPGAGARSRGLCSPRGRARAVRVCRPEACVLLDLYAYMA